MQDDLVNKVLDSAIENFRRQSRTSSYKSNPRQWCKDVLGIDLWSKQEDQFLALLENDHVAVRSAHGTGKATALTEVIPTPDGMKTMGELNEGDYVYAWDGTLTTVTWKSPVWDDRDIYKVTFDDGTSVEVDGEHEWNVFDINSRPKGVSDWREHIHQTATVTTRHMYDNLRTPSGQRRWRVPVGGVVNGYHGADLPMDPYTLGAWLGDGHTNGPYMTTHDDDIAIIEAFPYKAHKVKAKYLWSFAGTDMRSDLRKAGVLGNKHIPLAYKKVGTQERIALVQGIMDTDGHISESGAVSIDLANETLAYDLAEVLRSLGVKVNVRPRPMKLYGKHVGTRYRMNFTALDFNPFSLSRKAERWLGSDRASQRSRHTQKTVVSIEVVGKGQTQCIEVAHEDHLFLVGEGYTPTHNSFNAALVACWWVSTRYDMGEDVIVVTTAPTFHQVSAILWENIRKFHMLANERYEAGLSPVRMPGYVTMSNQWKSEKGTILGFGRKPADNNDHGFQGIHRRYVLVIVDEGCGIKENLFTAVEAITTTEDSCILVVGNPDDPATQFNKFFTTLAQGTPANVWHNIDISSFDSPNFTKFHEGHYESCNNEDPDMRKWCQERQWAKRWDRDKVVGLSDDALAQLPNEVWVEQRRAAWGTDSPLWQSKVLGQFPLQSVNTLFSRETINRGFDTEVKPDYRGKRVLGVDLARFGPDYSVVYMAEEGRVVGEDGKPTDKKGKKVRILDFWGGKADEAKADGMESALRVHQLAQTYGVDEVRIDGEGIGGPIRDRINQLSEGSYTVISVLGSSASPDRYRWGNARTYRFDNVREAMFMGTIDIDPKDAKLEGELEMIQYSYKNRWNSMQVESKDDIAKRGLKSPDYADALIYALADDLDSLAANPYGQYLGGEQVAMRAADYLTLIQENGWASPY